MVKTLGALVSQTLSLLAFRDVKIDSNSRPLAYGLWAISLAWVAGIGRYWDHPSPSLFELSGLRSVCYIFILSTVLYLIVWPIKRNRWSWLAVFVFVGLTSPLAWLYALPVERFTEASTAITLNVRFLMVVALWRVLLYGAFLWRYAGLRRSSFVAAWLAPLAIILFILVALNLEDAIFEIMAGIERERTPDEVISDSRFMAVNVLFVFSILTVPIWVIAYALSLYDKFKNRS